MDAEELGRLREIALRHDECRLHVAALPFLQRVVEIEVFLDLKVAPRGFWGVELADAEGGALVKAVLPGGPAERAGLKAGDLIQELDGKKVKNAGELLNRAGKVAAGTGVKLSVIRDAKPQEITLETEDGL